MHTLLAGISLFGGNQELRVMGGLSPGFVRAFRLGSRTSSRHAALLIQERPQREILGAGTSSVQKFRYVRICDTPAG